MMVYRWNVSSLLVAPARPVNRAAATGGIRASTPDERIDSYFSALPLDDIPNVRATAAHLTGHNIDFGLDIIIAGFKARIAERAGTAVAPSATACPAGARSRETDTRDR